LWKPLHTVLAFLTRFFEFEVRHKNTIVFSGLPQPTLQVQIKKIAPEGHYNLQQAVVPD
jgi:hypothetical protein